MGGGLSTPVNTWLDILKGIKKLFNWTWESNWITDNCHPEVELEPTSIWEVFKVGLRWKHGIIGKHKLHTGKVTWKYSPLRIGSVVKGVVTSFVYFLRRLSRKFVKLCFSMHQFLDVYDVLTASGIRLFGLLPAVDSCQWRNEARTFCNFLRDGDLF